MGASCRATFEKKLERRQRQQHTHRSPCARQCKNVRMRKLKMISLCASRSLQNSISHCAQLHFQKPIEIRFQKWHVYIFVSSDNGQHAWTLCESLWKSTSNRLWLRINGAHDNIQRVNEKWHDRSMPPRWRCGVRCTVQWLIKPFIFHRWIGSWPPKVSYCNIMYYWLQSDPSFSLYPACGVCECARGLK